MDKIKGMDSISTNIVKGIAVILLLFHHLYYEAETFTQFHISSFLTNDQILNFGKFSKTCLSLFVFASGFGLTKVYKDDFNYIYTRQKVIDLMKKYWFVFILFNIISIVFMDSFSKNHNLLTVYGNQDLIAFIVNFILDGLCLSTLLGTPSLNITWWWMPTAILIFILVPFLQNFVKKYKFLSYIMILFIIKITKLDANSSTYLLPTLILGIYLAQNNFFEILQENYSNNLIKRVFLIIFSLIFLILLFFARTKLPGVAFYDSLFPLPIAVLTIFVLREVTISKCILGYIGKESLLIFLIHTFIKEYWFSNFIYGFEKPILSLLTLLIICILITNVINFSYNMISKFILRIRKIL